MGVGLAFSPGSSETAFLLVPVLQKEVTNRSQAEEVLQLVHQSLIRFFTRPGMLTQKTDDFQYMQIEYCKS